MNDKRRMNFYNVLNNSLSQVRLVMNIFEGDYEREVAQFNRDNNSSCRAEGVDFDDFVPLIGSSSKNLRNLTRRNGSEYEANIFLYNVDFFNFIKPDAKMDALEKIVEIYATEEISHYGRVDNPSNVYMFMKPDAVLRDVRAGVILQKRVDSLVKTFDVFDYNDFV